MKSPDEQKPGRLSTDRGTRDLQKQTLTYTSGINLRPPFSEAESRVVHLDRAHGTARFYASLDTNRRKWEMALAFKRFDDARILRDREEAESREEKS